MPNGPGRSRPPRLRRPNLTLSLLMVCDSLGNPVHLEDASSASALNDFVDGFLSCEARVSNVLSVSSSEMGPLIQAYCAALHMFAESREAPVNARPYIDHALSSTSLISRREKQFVAAVAAWVDGDIAKAIAIHEQIADEFPRDLASVKLGQYHLFNQGNPAGMLRLALKVLPHAADVVYMHGMAAFAWEQCHLLEQAEEAARRALAMCAKEPWAQHALAHVMLTQGRLHEGLRFMQHSSPTWTGLNSFMQTHNWWHLALFALDLGQDDEVLRLYDQQVWGVVKEYTQDQIGAVSLLARLELAGVDVGTRWQDLADYLLARTEDHVLPFLDLQYLYGLARAGRPEALQLMRGIETHAEAIAPSRLSSATASMGTAGIEVSDVWRSVCLPAASGLLAHARGDHRAAIEDLGTALPRLLEIGGSHAQRDLFEQIYLDALIRGGRAGAAQHVLQQHLRAQPESVRLRRLAGPVYAQLGLGKVFAGLYPA